MGLLSFAAVSRSKSPRAMRRPMMRASVRATWSILRHVSALDSPCGPVLSLAGLNCSGPGSVSSSMQPPVNCWTQTGMKQVPAKNRKGKTRPGGYSVASAENRTGLSYAPFPPSRDSSNVWRGKAKGFTTVTPPHVKPSCRSSDRSSRQPACAATERIIASHMLKW